MSRCQTSGGGAVMHAPLGLRLARLWVAIRVGVWRCGLPIRWRVHSLPRLLHHLTPAPGQAPRRVPLALDQAVRLVRRICRLRCFRGPLFPQACLRQALALYHLLSRLGYPVEIHVGVYQAGEALRGHSWVTVDGKSVAERIPPEALQTIYAFPAPASSGSPERSSVGR
jgi:Transglutaminase-like superfamily